MVFNLKRDEATTVLKELIDSCPGLDGHPLELTPPATAAAQKGEGYQIFIIKTLDEQTKKCVIDIVTHRKLSYQSGSLWKKRCGVKEPDTFIIFKQK